MHKPTLYIIKYLILAMLSPVLAAYTIEPVEAQNLSVNSNDKSCRIERLASMPMTYYDYHPIVQATVNGHPINMSVDTGAEVTMMTPGSVDYLHLASDPDHSTRVRSGNDTMTRHNALLESFQFGDVDLQSPSMAIVSHGDASTDDSGGANGPIIGGVLGADILSKFDVEMDFPNQIMTLYHLTGCDRTAIWHNLPFSALGMTLTPAHRILLPLRVDGQLVKALFDTSSKGVVMTRDAALRLGVSEDDLAHDQVDNHSGGLNGQFDTVPKHRFNSIQIGQETFPNPTFDIIAPQRDQVDMLLGANFMKHRHFWISYATGYVFIRLETPGKAIPAVQAP